jgi:hypothetical protein
MSTISAGTTSTTALIQTGDTTGSLILQTGSTPSTALTLGSDQTSSFAASQREVITVSATAATGTINYDAITQGVLYYTTNASANWTLNVRGNSTTSLNSLMSVGQSLSICFLVTQGSTAYYQSALTIDGTSVTPKWQGGTAPTLGNVSGVDSYSLVIVKTASATFTVFEAQTQFK